MLQERKYVPASPMDLFPHLRIRPGQRRALKSEEVMTPDLDLPLVITGPTGSGKTPVFASIVASLEARGLVKRAFLTGPRNVSKWNVTKTMALIAARHGRKLCRKYGLPRFITAVLFPKTQLCRLVKEDAVTSHPEMKREEVYEFCKAAKDGGFCPYWERFCKITEGGKGLSLGVAAKLQGKSLVIAERGLLKDVLRSRALKKYGHTIISAEDLDSEACPFYLTIATLPYVQVVVCDFNYLVNFNVRRATIQNLLDKDSIIVWDEASEMPERARDAYRHTLSLDTVEGALAEIEGSFIPEKGRNRLMKQFNMIFSDSKVLGKADTKDLLTTVMDRIKALHRNRTRAFIANRKRYSHETEEEEMALVPCLDTLLYGINRDKLVELERLGINIVKFKVGHKRYRLGVRSHVLAVHNFLANMTSFTNPFLRYFVTDRQDEKSRKDIRIGRFSVSAMPAVQPVLNDVKHSIFVSATILDNWFRAMIGIPEHGRNKVSIESPFKPEQRLDIIIPKHHITMPFRENKAKMRTLAKDLSKLVEASPVSCIIVVTQGLWSGLSPHMTELCPSLTFREEPVGATHIDRDNFYNEIKKAAKTGTKSTIGVIHPWGALSSSHDMSFIKLWIAVGIPIKRRSVESEEIHAHLTRVLGSEVAAFLSLYTLAALERNLQALGRGQRFEDDYGAFVLMDDRYGKEYYQNVFRKAHAWGTELVTKDVNEAVFAIRRFMRKMGGRKW
jgi:Rad3-related DNA helicase